MNDLFLPPERPPHPAGRRPLSGWQLKALDSARGGQTDLLESMLAAGLSPQCADEHGQGLLHLASYHGHFETTRLLLRHGAWVDRRNDRGQTALGGVAFRGHLSLARLLLDHGADVEADQGGGRTPLMLAAMFGRTVMVELLIEAGASLQQRDECGVSAAWMAKLSQGGTRILQRLRSEAVEAERRQLAVGDRG